MLQTQAKVNMALYEKYRPRQFSDVLGNPKAVRCLESACRRGIGGRAVWISGGSGFGKTTLARIVASSIADPDFIAEYDSADDISAAELDRIRDTMVYFGGGRGGRAIIINEAHGLRKPIIRALLGVIERLPSHCVIIFTTTREGEQGLFEDQIDASPLLSRCIVVRLSNQGLAPLFAARAKEIAESAGMDGQPLSRYVKLANDNRSNMRAMLTAIESGAMVEP